jgi:hypothetical protein
VFKLQCDLFSLAKITAFREEKEIEHTILEKLNKPNPFQTQRQFLWDFMFWNMFGVSYLNAASKVLTDENNMYWLNTANVNFPNKLQEKLDKHYFSKQEVRKLGDEIVKYHYNDNTKRNIKLKEIHPFVDLTNGTGNWYGSNSALDALYKIVANSESASGAKNINLDFSGKFLVGGDTNASNIYEQPLGEGEKKSIEDIFKSKKRVTAVKSQINIARFVENISNLKLDEAYFSDYYKIGKMYGIPKDVLEANLGKGGTFENQEKARGSHVAYTLEPKSEDLANGLESYFGLDVQLKFSWSHLQFMQVFEKEKADVKKVTADTFKTYVDAGVTPESAAEILELELKFKKQE